MHKASEMLRELEDYAGDPEPVRRRIHQFATHIIETHTGPLLRRGLDLVAAACDWLNELEEMK